MNDMFTIVGSHLPCLLKHHAHILKKNGHYSTKPDVRHTHFVIWRMIDSRGPKLIPA